jgi:UDP-N-acetylglucosamine transferase subunit ALG13
LVASTGGHLEELYRLKQCFAPEVGDVEWVTFDTPQSRFLLARERVHFVPFVKPKDAKGTLASTAAALQLLRRGRFVRVISTGAAIAVPFLTEARLLGLGAHYIESAARTTGPSLSGSLLARIPGVRLYGQYQAWTSGHWQYRGTVFDGLSPGPARPRSAPRRIVVTFGTQQDFGFRRAAERLVEILAAVCSTDADILWQTGSTDMAGLGVDSVETVPNAHLLDAVRRADLIVSHAGVGSALLALRHGKCPVLLPRLRAMGEHTDDHQTLIAQELAWRHLAVAADASELSARELLTAASMTAVASAQSPQYPLQPD